LSAMLGQIKFLKNINKNIHASLMYFKKKKKLKLCWD